mmetsp:Transcript_7224/g.19710  ORF Transcript_7224/g.19710 Transcript_7224/m.19710 type:complete len:335 (+) Transcript_7224:306-1310(+)
MAPCEAGGPARSGAARGGVVAGVHHGRLLGADDDDHGGLRRRLALRLLLPDFRGVLDAGGAPVFRHRRVGAHRVQSSGLPRRGRPAGPRGRPADAPQGRVDRPPAARGAGPAPPRAAGAPDGIRGGPPGPAVSGGAEGAVPGAAAQHGAEVPALPRRPALLHRRAGAGAHFRLLPARRPRRGRGATHAGGRVRPPGPPPRALLPGRRRQPPRRRRPRRRPQQRGPEGGGPHGRRVVRGGVPLLRGPRAHRRRRRGGRLRAGGARRQRVPQGGVQVPQAPPSAPQHRAGVAQRRPRAEGVGLQAAQAAGQPAQLVRLPPRARGARPRAAPQHPPL